mgnify:CR=1 FL=1|jgi:hypothetical protein
MEPAVDQREADIVRTLVRLADTLVAGYDELELLRDLSMSSVRILDGTTAGVVIGTDDRLGFVIATSEAMDIIELFQTEHQEGPCTDAYRTGRDVHCADIDANRERWPNWAPRALDLGFRSADAFPMRLRQRSVGALNVYSTHVRPLGERDVAVGRALADMATIGMLHQRAVGEHELVESQLQQALDSRVVIEQAKGVLSARHGLTMDEAFDRLRRRARSTNTRLAEIARQVADRQLDL